MSAKPETVFRKRVAADLQKLQKTAVFPIQQKAINGDPDYILCLNGFFVGLELKAEKGRVSPLQKYKLTRIKLSGGLGLVAYPSDWESIFTELEKLSRAGRVK